MFLGVLSTRHCPQERQHDPAWVAVRATHSTRADYPFLPLFPRAPSEQLVLLLPIPKRALSKVLGWPERGSARGALMVLPL